MIIVSRIILFGLGLHLACAAALAADGPAEPVKINIDQPALYKALLQFSQQAGLNLVFQESEKAGELSAPRLSGTYTPRAALEKLLQDSGYTYEFIGPQAVAIRARSSESAQLEPTVGLGDRVTTQSSQDGAKPNAGNSSAQAPWRVAQMEENKEGDRGNAERRGVSTEGGPQVDATLEEIVVTAQKREERLQDVPIAISVLNGQELDQSTSSNVGEALRSVPSIDFGQTGGYVGGGMISLRGVSNGLYREGGSSTVAYYIDGTPYGLVRSATVPLDANLYDLEQIEVLRGPQGSLYGANALNGVIRVLTRDANTREFDLKARSFLSNTRGGDSNYGGDLAVNVPIIQDKLAARATIGYRSDDGWIDSPIESNVNTSELQSYRLKVGAQPTDTLSINLSAWHSKSERGAPALSDDDERITSLQSEFGSIEYDVFGAEITKEFDAFSITSMTSSIDLENQGMFDGNPANFPGQLFTSLKSQLFTEELNIVSRSDGRWRWSVGAFYRDAKDDTFQILDFLPPLEELLGVDRLVNNDYRDTSESSAVYGELGYKIFDNLEFAAGLRYFRDKQSTRIKSPYIDLPLTPFRSTAEATTPRFVMTWLPTAENTFYGSYSQGFRSGVVQAPNIQARFPNYTPAKPDKLHNYEVGAKGLLMGGLLAYEAAVYYIDWQDVQQTLEVELLPGFTSTVIVNAVSASGAGTEFTLTAHPAEQLEIGGSVTWNDLTLDGDLSGASGVIAPKGGRLADSPKYTAGMFAQYSFPLGGNLTGRLAASGNYKSRQTGFRSTGNQLVALSGDDRFDGGRVNFSVESKAWTTRLFVDNVLDKYSSQDPIESNGGRPSDTEWRERPRPRTFGLQVEFQY